jgi:hypothetical protein
MVGKMATDVFTSCQSQPLGVKRVIPEKKYEVRKSLQDGFENAS